MKEVTAELNVTVIVLISVGILAAFFFSFIWPMINYNFERNSSCSKATCNCNNNPENGDIKLVKRNGIFYCTCQVIDEKGNAGEEFYCVYKG